MAAADLLVVIFDPLLKWTVPTYFPESFLFITSMCFLISFMKFAATVLSVWLTVAFTFDRFVAICCDKLKTKYCTKKTAAVVVGTVSVLACLVSLPLYFSQESRYIIDNVARGCAYKPSFFTSPAWVAFELSYYILTPCVPFVLMLLLNVLTVRRIVVSIKIRRELRGRSKGENHKDLEMESRKKSIILLFSISSSFILLWATRVLYVIYRRITDIRSYHPGPDPRRDVDHSSVMLQVLSSCTNTCIYAVTQTKFRQELKNAVQYPFNLIVKLVKS
ncbi:neuropeptide receptor 22-like [Heterodontus francisci]|uniref:neuropeptide receptor 22-like n=1 Tax=Heterodontus francisci TaxID=7792 RepID=UPI00355BFF35